MSMEPDLDFKSAGAIARAVLGGQASHDAATRRADAAIKAGNDTINAVVGYDPGQAVPQLDALRARLESGEKPPLAGVPLVVKDHIQVQGWPATQGSRLFEHFVSERDDLVVQRLRAAGAIIVGRSNMSEFGAKGVTTNLVYGPTRHPLELGLTTGGSSGGAAAALAAGFVPLALGSDGGGSARRPAAHAGVVGFKPSAGAVASPRELSQTSVLAPMARTVADIRLLFEAILGPDPRDPFSLALPAWTASRPARIAWSPKLGLSVPVDADVAERMEAAIATLRSAGLDIVDRDPIWPDQAGEDAVMPLQHAAMAARFGDEWRRDPARFDPDIGDQIEAGLALPATAVAKAAAMSTEIAGAMARFFAGGVDFLLSPTTPCTAWPLTRLGPERIGGVAVPHRGHAVFTPLINHALCTAISLPAGHGRDGLPVGLQIVGPRFSDHGLLAFAETVEAALAGGSATQTAPKA